MGYDGSTALDLAPLHPMFAASAFSLAFFEHIQQVHREIRLQDMYFVVKEKVDQHYHE